MKWLLNYFSAPAQPTRVGKLNTGELVLVHANGCAQVIAAHTTELIREALEHDAGPPIAEEAVLTFPYLREVAE